ncbi:MAG: hypothetical protein QW429_04015 [Thermoprotei archaeon]
MGYVLGRNGVYPFAGGVSDVGGPVFSSQITLNPKEEIQISNLRSIVEALTITASASNSDNIWVGQTGAENYPLTPGMSVTLRKVLLSTVFLVNRNATSSALIYVIWS